MARTTVLPLANYPAGTRVIGPVALGDALSRLRIEVQRCTSAAPTVWPSADARLATRWEISLDGGATWGDWIVTEDLGGISVSPKTGLEVPLLTIDGQMPAGTNRQLRATIDLSAVIRTSAVVDVT